jgi:SAM-dependent methyltransferase
MPAIGDATQTPTIWRAFVAWWYRNIFELGFPGTLKLLLHELWSFLRDATPSRRKQRYGDIEFDCDYRVNTTSAGVSLRTHFLGVLAGGPYQPSDPVLLRETLANLEIDYSEFIFIDLGSGKGRALLLASDYPFQRIIGVELLPEFHCIALDNIAKYRSDNQKCFAIECLLGDAEEYSFPPAPLVLYLFNPLPEVGLRRVIARLEESLREHPRPVYVLYLNPMLEHILAESSLLRKVSSSLQSAVYCSQRETAQAKSSGK